MSTRIQKTPKSVGRHSVFFQDLATPVSSRRSAGKFATPGQSAAVSALWRENLANSDLPPPPVFTLDDHADFSPESGIADYPSPEVKSDPRTPGLSFGREFSSPKSKFETSTSYAAASPKSKSEASTSYAAAGKQKQNQQSPLPSLTWWSPSKTGGGTEQDDKGKGSPVDGVVQPGTSVIFPPPSEVARPEMKKNTVPMENLDGEEWVTVYGFSPADTNLVLRELEKCGTILKHVHGPRESNWMHVLYQNRADAQKALHKNGTQIHGILILGVKPVDPIEREALNERRRNQGFMTSPDSVSFADSPYTGHLQNGSRSRNRQSDGAVAKPAKSVVSQLMDFVFGV